jgi:LmbE family N-acetylglucosaminyl deacetylase
MAYTVVAFHAHPDDEVLLTGGTLARAASEGHRVVLVTATAGGAGLTSTAIAAAGDLADRRFAELGAAGVALGVYDLRLLGYDDSGMDGQAGRDGRAFARVEVDEAAGGLAEILASVSADMLIIYDPAGGYGHPDHVQVHRVGLRAAELAATPVVLEATVDRTALLRLLRWLHRLGLLRWAPAEWQPERLAASYTDPAVITHRVDVRGHLSAKRAAMAAHLSQRGATEGRRPLTLFLMLPLPIYRRVFGHEWFTERGRTPKGRPLDDIFSTLKELDDNG